jgi:RNA polymerase sigma-70 factor (ECF subfamily)
MPDVEPALPGALARLPERQRVAVLLVHGWDWRHEDVAALMGVSVSTVRNHLTRGLDKLRTELGVPAHD